MFYGNWIIKLQTNPVALTVLTISNIPKVPNKVPMNTQPKVKLEDSNIHVKRLWSDFSSKDNTSDKAKAHNNRSLIQFATLNQTKSIQEKFWGQILM